MNEVIALRRQVLAVAASARRRLSLSRPQTMLSFAKPGQGPTNPVLMIGALPVLAPFSWDGSIEITASDENRERLNLTVSYLKGQGVSILRVLHSAPDNLRLDLEALSNQWDLERPVSLKMARQFLSRADQSAHDSPVIPDGHFAVVYCTVLNECVDDVQRIGVIRETYRVLRRGGVARFLVDLSDEPTADVELLTEGRFCNTLANTGYYGMVIVDRSEWPIAVNEGAEIRSYVFDAYRGKDGLCLDCRQSVIYRGPWKKVFDDDGHAFERDVRTAVCEKTFRIMSSAPYSGEIFPVEPHMPTPISEAPHFSCVSSVRKPSIGKALSPQDGSRDQESCC